ncbi:M15 family metallopeptidase [Bacillus sp. PK3-056]|uniref:M15 family metallopeptidase n=1 Tax=Niallia circulans TaxID=1397 RepID=UPI000F45783C|nr:M15 family metallopeptidase [Niallia circulans]AYV74493.1 peptidase M15 [Niallia circulans]
MSLKTLQDKAIKRMGAVKPIVKEKVLDIIEQAYNEGIYVLITDGYRSYAEQDALYAQGRTKPGKIVTNAKGGQSNHNFGIAVDFCLTNKEGTAAYWIVNKDWKRVAAIAKSKGFEWGGDWTSFKDNPHLEYTGKITVTPE